MTAGRDGAHRVFGPGRPVTSRSPASHARAPTLESLTRSAREPRLGLRGRHAECALLDRLLDGVRAGQSRILVLRGEQGVGKTALLDYLAERASGCRVARAAGVEIELELAFAGLHQLCASMLDRLERLPGPQRDALRTAFGLTAGPAPHWQDRASAHTLGFVARRLLAESVALVITSRTVGASRPRADRRPGVARPRLRHGAAAGRRPQCGAGVRRAESQSVRWVSVIRAPSPGSRLRRSSVVPK